MGRVRVFVKLAGLASGTLLGACAAAATIAGDGGKVQDALERVAEWQLRHIVDIPKLDSAETGWVQASFYIGLARLAATENDAKYFEAIRKLGERNNWQLGPRLYHADDHAIGQVYAAAFDHFHDPRMIAPMAAQFDRILADKPNVPLILDQSFLCLQRWCWCDALFMAPASWLAASRITGDQHYREYAETEYWATKDYLFDPGEHLFFRDSRFFGQWGLDGKKMFWGRGNGWVLAGLANILRELPTDDPSRPRYEALFVEMAEKLLTLQRSDGFWGTSLESPPSSSTAESSSTALFVYGFASGVNLGLLNPERFEKATLLGWNALVGAVDPDGRLGRVQQIGEKPGAVDPNDWQAYGSGGFLLAGTAIKIMMKAKR